MPTKITKYNPNIPLARVDTEKLEDLFTEAVRQIGDNYKNKLTFEDVECRGEKLNAGRELRVQVTVYGMAGVSTRRQIHNKANDSVHTAMQVVPITLPDGTQLQFRFVDSAELNSNDYVLYYCCP